MKAAAGRWAGILVIAALQFYWYYLPAPLPMKILTAVFTAVCIAWPQRGFMLLALLAPVSTSLSSQLGRIEPGGFLLEQLILAACAGSLVRSSTGPPTRLGAPAAVMAVIALMSAAAMAPASAAASTPPGLENGPYTFWLHLLDRGAASNSAVWAPVLAAMMVAESCLLGWVAEREIRKTPALVTSLLWLLLAGHAVQALLSIDQLIRFAQAADGSLRLLQHRLLTSRLNPQMEVHAAGSALVLAGIAGMALIAGSRARRASALLLVAIVAAGLWISGSRLAIVAAAGAGTIALAWWGLQSSRRAAMFAAAATIVVIAAGWFAVGPRLGRYGAASASIQTRLMMAETSMRLFSTAPVFGIGIHQFYSASAGALDPDFPALSGYSHENAHNNFLQVLTEQGLVGLAAMLWWLGLLCVGAWSARKHDGPLRQRDALFLAVLACAGTWLGGHPLLVREFSTIFFFFAAILAALTPAASAFNTRVAAVTVAVLALSLPVRAVTLRNAQYLEDQGFGLSRWVRDAEHHYREAGSTFHLYLQSGTTVQLPLRLVDEVRETAFVEVHVGGRVVQERRLASDQWRIVDIEVPQSTKGFQLATMTVRMDGGAVRQGPVVLVGRVIHR
ncbi:MAG TPA: O-antigen ligase family protein [Vicinamibacterales bacterium]|nr:O-antigen ligase family protein [Vicinamibacterales bacterium]